MPDIQAESNKGNGHQLHKERFSVQELQTTLRSKRFKRITNAHRILDMSSRHSKNLFRYFPDETINVGDVKNAKVFEDDGFESKKIRAQVLHLSKEQEEELVDETEKGRDLIEVARLFVGFYDNRRKEGSRIGFRTGHEIKGSPMPLSLSPQTVDEKKLSLMDYEISFRGLLIEMSGNFRDNTVLLIDPGNSRWLYDWYIMHGRKDEFMQQIISGLTRDFYLWLGRNNPKLVICDYDYNIEVVSH